MALAACTIAAVALLLLAAAGPGYRIGLLSLPHAFTLLRWGAYVGIAAVTTALLAGAWAYRRKARGRMILAGIALAAGAVALAVPLRWQLAARTAPPILDISTDLENPPTFEAVAALRADAPNALERPANLREQQREAYPDLGPITLSLPPSEAFDRALAAAQDAGWRIVTADKGSGRIEATATTRWFGFQDDVVVRLTPWGAGTRVDMRSVSRLGRGDVGTNARRIQRYLDGLQSSAGS
jgi:uncharacterized protein (DUF1499 family)